MKKKYTLFVSFPLNPDWTGVDLDLRARVKTHNGTCVASGAGFGQRDVEYEFNVTPDEAKEIKKDVIAFFKKRNIKESKVSIRQ